MFLAVAIALLCVKYIGAVDDIQFIAVSPNTTLPNTTISGFQYIARNIEKLSANYSEIPAHVTSRKVLVSGSEEKEQFHGVIHDNTGSYYSSKSVVAHTCSLKEVNNTAFFYDEIPTVFTAGSAALIPCLVAGIPTPTKRVQRCSSRTCEDLLQLEFPDYVQTADSHLVVRQAATQDSGWYRCVASNLCGTLISKPNFISIRERPADEEPTEYPAYGFVISQKTDDFFLSETDDLVGPTKELKRNLTEYDLWKLNTASPSYNDEVLYLNPGSIYRYYYPTFDNGLISDNGYVLEELNYGIVSHNNSFVTHFSILYPILPVVFTTEVFMRPDIIPHPFRAEDPEEAVINFSVYNYKMPMSCHTCNIASSVQCYRDTLRLENDWKIRINVLESKISIILRYPVKSDSGNYQCAISQGILYVSRPVYVTIIDPITTYRTHRKTTPTSVKLSWELLPLKNFQYEGNFVVFLSGHNPVTTSNNSIEYTNLLPHSKYYWHVTSSGGTPITDTNVFRTNKTIPTSNVGNISVIRRENELLLSWPSFPNTSWFDDFVYFVVNVTTNSSVHPRHGEVQTLKTHTEAARITELDEATEYNITISACNSQGCGENVTRFTAATRHYQIRDIPTVTLLYIGLNQAEIEIGGIVNATSAETYLDVFPGNLCFNASSRPSKNLMKIQTPIAILEKLKTFTRYSLRVQITNGYSTSPWSSCVSFKTRFNWLHVLIPAACVILVIALIAVLRAAIKNRCPDVINKLKQALEPKYVNILPGDEWETSNEVAIIHTKIENCSV